MRTGERGCHRHLFILHQGIAGEDPDLPTTPQALIHLDITREGRNGSKEIPPDENNVQERPGACNPTIENRSRTPALCRHQEMTLRE